MDQLAALRTFVAISEKGSFAEAARSLGMSPTAASRAIAELEDALGVTLLRRTTRSVALTPEGATYLECCRHVIDELDDAARSLRGDKAEPRGSLIVTAPVVFGRMHVLPILTRLLRAYPALDARLMLTDRVVRMAEEGIDVAVRIAELPDSALHAVQIARVRRVLVASPQYLGSRGTPKDPAALRDHDLVAFDNFTRNGEWRFGPANQIAVKCAPRMLTNSVETAVDAAVAGIGITRVLDYQVEHHVSAGRLTYLLTDYDPPAVPVSLVYQPSRLRSPNVRVMIEQSKRYFAGSASRAGMPNLSPDP